MKKLARTLTGNIRFSTITKGWFKKRQYVVLEVEVHALGQKEFFGSYPSDYTVFDVDETYWRTGTVEDLTEINLG